MVIRLLVLVAVLMSSVMPFSALALQTVPQNLYPALEYALTIPSGKDPVEPEKLSTLVDFVRAAAPGVGMTMESRDKASGAFHAFAVQGDLERVARYAYNPDVPEYMTMPSSIRDQMWKTPRTAEDLRRLPPALGAGEEFLTRGTERVTITPDSHTGGYYSYMQDMAVAAFPGPTGPVLVSVSIQADPSEVGHKGCVVGNDAHWNYLYSMEKGLNKTGLGWVNSYMYSAHSVLVLVQDTEKGMVRAGTFKWLHAGWSGINMVKPAHIVNGMKRFSGDFTLTLDSGRLPKAEDLAAIYLSLKESEEGRLREMVAPHLEALSRSGDSAVQSSPFKNLLQSGEYLENMSKAEMVNMLMLQHLKEKLGVSQPVG